MALKKRIGLAIAILTLGANSAPALASPQYCAGTIIASWTRKTGDVLIESSWRQNHTQICNIKYEWKGVPVDTCIAWVAKLDAAVVMNKRVIIYYSEAPTCDVLPTYGDSPAPYYVMLRAS